MISEFKCNQISVEELFAKYAEVGFLYPAKMKLLWPYLAQIQLNWQQLLKAQGNLLWILTNTDEHNFASIVVLFHSNHGLLAQHLVSDGNPRLSLQLMAQAQQIVENIGLREDIRSSQNWFRPSNRYAFRIFASMYEKLGKEKASILSFDYLHLPIKRVECDRSPFIVEEVVGYDPTLYSFVEQQYNTVFCEGEELSIADITYAITHQKYQQLGLNKRRKIVKLLHPNSREILACVIGNRAPIGLNFSFLENRAYFIVDDSLSVATSTAICRAMSNSMQDFYHDFELQAIPIVTNQSTSTILQAQGAQYLRTYFQSIWLRTGFAQWRAHIEGFLQRISRQKME